MPKAEFDIVNSDQFVDKYMGNSDGLSYRYHPVQIYPLENAAALLKIPTPYFRAEFNFLLIFSSGGGTQQIYNDTVTLKANDVLFIREGHLNAIRAVDLDSKGYFIHIDSSVLPLLVDDRTLLNRLTFQPKLSLNDTDIEWLCQCAGLIRASGADDSPGIATSLLRAMFLKISKRHQEQVIGGLDRPTEVNLNFKELLYANFKDKRDVSYYAGSLAVSENYLNRCVKSISGKSPKQHINEVVIYYSQILLQNAAKDISEIAFELNFADPAYFGRLFKQVTGLTPTEYRLRNSQALSA